LTNCTFEKKINNFLYVASITEHNASLQKVKLFSEKGFGKGKGQGKGSGQRKSKK